MAAANALPETFAQTLSKLAPPSLAVAVSGGADSMALLLMAQAWAKQHSCALVALTVDHGLRKTSASEAQQVAAWCKARTIEHHILRWKNPVANQAMAREARYALLGDWCKTHGIGCLLTAHHRGDQAETLFFRLARGSGISGLACMMLVSNYDGLALARPLLGVGKTELEHYLREQNQPWLEDPSNSNMKYARSVIRAHIRSLPNGDAIEIQAARLAQRFGDIRIALENQLQHAMQASVSDMDEKQALLKESPFAELPPVLAKLVLARLIQAFNGDDHPPRSEKLDRLYQTLLSKQQRRTTLAGLLFTRQPKKQRILITRETGYTLKRRQKPPI